MFLNANIFYCFKTIMSIRNHTPVFSSTEPEEYFDISIIILYCS